MVPLLISHGQDVYLDCMVALEGFYVGTMGLITVPMGQKIKDHGLSHGHVSNFTPWGAVHCPWSLQTFSHGKVRGG
jgi:hypothetical protein